MEDNGKSKDDVLWCGSKEFGWFSFDDFTEIASIEYSSGYGGQEIAKDLVIAGKDFWLERVEYDGSEWWEFKTTPEKPNKYCKPITVKNNDSWATLIEMNRIGGKYI